MVGEAREYDGPEGDTGIDHHRTPPTPVRATREPRVLGYFASHFTEMGNTTVNTTNMTFHLFFFFFIYPSHGQG